MPRLITLLTDFGTADGYVGEMKGVLAPHDIDGARLALARYWRRFPAGTVHLVVVDPGVGSARGALAATSEGRFLVGPDNGVLSPALLHADAPCVSLAIPSGVAPFPKRGRADLSRPRRVRSGVGNARAGRVALIRPRPRRESGDPADTGG